MTIPLDKIIHLTILFLYILTVFRLYFLEKIITEKDRNHEVAKDLQESTIKALKQKLHDEQSDIEEYKKKIIDSYEKRIEKYEKKLNEKQIYLENCWKTIRYYEINQEKQLVKHVKKEENKQLVKKEVNKTNYHFCNACDKHIEFCACSR